MTRILIQPLTTAAFAPFGDVLQLQAQPDKLINQGLCGRHHDLANMSFQGGRAGISLFDAQPRSLPYTLEMVERHPDGSQAFIPMSQTSFLVIVAQNVGGKPGRPLAFETKPGQAVNYHRGTWHGVLTPLSEPGQFAVVDRIGPGTNLEEHWFERPFIVSRT